MNGVALLTALALVGADEPQVKYSSRTTEDGQIEYTIEVPDVFIKPLVEGEQIHSPVPAEVGQVQRICIRVGNTPVPHTAASVARFRELLANRVASRTTVLGAAEGQVAIYWPAQGLPQATTAVTYGWQPDPDGKQAYFVQIDPTTLAALKPGDEVHATIDPAAGDIETFVVMAGTKPPPRQTRAPPRGPAPTATGPSAPAGRQGGAPAFTPSPPSSTPPSSRAPSSRFTTESPAAAAPPSDITPIGSGSQYAPFAPNSLPTAGTAGRESPPTAAGYGEAPLPTPGGQYSLSDDPRLSDPRTNPQYAPSTSNINVQPPANAGYGQTPGYGQSQGYGPPPAYNQYAGGLDTSRTLQPPADRGPSGGYNPVNDVSRAPPFQAQYPASPDARVAALPPQSVAAPTAPTTTASATPPAEAPRSADDQWWWPYWLLLMFSLFLSIGVNLYLGWTTAEYYNRYRQAIDRLRTASRGV